jgi:hypothetical protein
MEIWENGYAWIEEGKIKPDDGSELVYFARTAAFQVATGPVKFHRSISDRTWADKVIPREDFNLLFDFFNAPETLTKAGADLIVAEIASFVTAAKSAPTPEKEAAHLEFARKRLSTIEKELRQTSGRHGVRVVRQLLVKKR